MNFTYVEFPCTAAFNTFKAYFNLSDVKLPKIHGKSFQCNEASTEGHISEPKSLRHLVLDVIAEHWGEQPIFEEIPRQEDRNYIVSNLDVNLPLKLLSTRIRVDFFWCKSYQHRWRISFHNQTSPMYAKPWINIYMERHLQEFIENLENGDYDADTVQTMLDTCATYINQLEINFLQPAARESQTHNSDHIPLDFILNNLPELHTLRLTYCTKTVGTNFFLGCNTLSQNDTMRLARGLSRSHELRNFCLHSTSLQPYQLCSIARSLDKGCLNLTTLSFKHCSFGDEGIRQFLETCTKESFMTLKTLDLTNNKLTADGAYILIRALKNLKLEKLILRLNPIANDGAAAVFSLLYIMPVEYLDISGCSLTDSIMKLFMKLIIQNRFLTHLDISNNNLGEEFGKHLYKIIGFNKVLQHLDLRNTGFSCELRNQFKQILSKNQKAPEASDYFQFDSRFQYHHNLTEPTSSLKKYVCKNKKPKAHLKLRMQTK